MIYNFFGFAEVRILPSFLAMTSFVIGFQISLYYVLQNMLSALKNFNSLGCLDLILQKWFENIPPQCCTGSRKPSAFRVKREIEHSENKIVNYFETKLDLEYTSPALKMHEIC